MAKETYVSEIARYEGMKKTAIAKWDGVNYVNACEGLGIEPELVDLYEQGIMEKRYDAFLDEANQTGRGLEGIADSGAGKVVKPVKKVRKVSKNHDKYAQFIKATKKAGVDVDRIMADTLTKRNLLIEVMGYSNLMGQGGRVNILEAIDSRIGSAYKACYNQARKEHTDL